MAEDLNNEKQSLQHITNAKSQETTSRRAISSPLAFSEPSARPQSKLST